MAVYEGVLTKLSGGIKMVSGQSAADSFVRHEFITIGDQRIKSVRLLAYHDALLQDAIGQRVALSVTEKRGEHLVMALRLPDGTVEKLDRRAFTGPMVVMAIRRVVYSAILLAIGWLAFLMSSNPILLLVFGAIAALLLVPFALSWRGAGAARAALDGRPAAPAASQ